MKNFLLILVLISMPVLGFAHSLSPQEIVDNASHASLYQGDDLKGKISIEIKDRLGRKRMRALNIMRKNVEGCDDQKYFVLFLRPADVKKMVFMVLKNSDLEKDDDRWLYMPGLDLVKRIAASDKRTSFAGSDFLYEDISGRNTKEDTHKLIKTTDELYLIKSTPKNKSGAEFEYFISYIDKKTFLPAKIEYYKKNNRLYRVIKNEKVENIIQEKNGEKISLPTVVLSRATDLDTGGESVMTLSKVKYNTGIKESIFSERYLRKPPRSILR